MTDFMSDQPAVMAVVADKLIKAIQSAESKLQATADMDGRPARPREGGERF
jgi:hypothetical protein